MARSVAKFNQCARLPIMSEQTGSEETQASEPVPASKEPAARKQAAKDNAVTPMMAQFLSIKKDHPDELLFYRMGDFYELFFDDAVKAAAALDIVLTKRGKHLGEDIQMCGVPVHAYDNYLQRLIKAGFRVAVAEQTENPAEAKKRGPKSVVAREVVRVVTPGTLIEDTLLDSRSHNFLAAIARSGGQIAYAWTDMSTGDFFVSPGDEATLGAEIARLSPSELLLAENMLQVPELFETFNDWADILTPLPASKFDSQSGERRLKSLYNVASLDGFGQFSRPELAALGGLVDYLDLTQKGKLPNLKAPKRLSAGTSMAIDAATRRNLELVRTLSGEKRGSLLSVIDQTVTGAGARLLAGRLSAPLTDPAAINARLDDVGFFMDAPSEREAVRQSLKATPDIERALSRLTMGRGGPRDLAAVRDGLKDTAVLRVNLMHPSLAPVPQGVADIARDLGHHETLVERLTRALAAELPLLSRDGGYIAPGYDAALDELRGLRDESRRMIAAMQVDYAKETGVSGLKIKHNNVLGYFIEVTAIHGDKIMSREDDTFIHRQTMANAVRFTTTELGELERKISSAADRALALESQLFEALLSEIRQRNQEIIVTAEALAKLDVATGLAELSVLRRYARPTIDDSLEFKIEGGRHPVVEAALEKAAEGDFIANDCDLSDAQRLWLLTGPNMAGKSTFLRQNALVVVLAQMGSYVPAKSARIGAVDRLFSRVGAADDLARGRSTFMVEMVEAAAILNQSGNRSLVILDEIGRGTATFDGLSIAWAVIEHLHEVNRCRSLFATHYHELTSLSAKLPALSNHTMRVKEWQGEVVFLHEVTTGSADRSYGIQVAKLAGLPGAVVDRAGEVLAILEEGDQAGAVSRLADDLPLFAAAPKSGLVSFQPAEASVVEEELSALHPDEMTPKEALEALYRLRGLLK
jgi:DNA mismatch repair protein MutS